MLSSCAIPQAHCVFQDWNYIVGKCLELTLELSDNKWPPEMGLAALWEDNRQALLDFAVTAALGG